MLGCSPAPPRTIQMPRPPDLLDATAQMTNLLDRRRASVSPGRKQRFACCACRHVWAFSILHSPTSESVR